MAKPDKVPGPVKGVLILPAGELSPRNKTLRRLAMANGWSIEFVGGKGDKYRGAGLTEPVYFDECPDDFPE